jgi:hypothetical protein
LLPYWRDEIISNLDEINKKRKIIIHGISFVDPHREISDGNPIEYKKGEDVINIDKIRDLSILAKKTFEKLLYINMFYTSKKDDAVMDAFQADVLGKLDFTFYPVSNERGCC